MGVLLGREHAGLVEGSWLQGWGTGHRGAQCYQAGSIAAPSWPAFRQTERVFDRLHMGPGSTAG